MRGMKYVTYEGPNYPTAIIFETTIDHIDAVRRFNIDAKDILGAGFIQYTLDEGIICCGQSTTLDVLARGPHDVRIIARLLRP